MQGILVQCLNRLDREERCIEAKGGRVKGQNETEKELLRNTALTLSIHGQSKGMAVELKQKIRKPKIAMEDLHIHGLPNPAMSLLEANAAQLESNMVLVDQQYPRSSKAATRRLVQGIDATYLLRTVGQAYINGGVFLVGGSWSVSDEGQALADLTVPSKTITKASIMTEFLLWDPAARRRDTFSIAAMPMSLKAPQQQEGVTQVHALNWEPLM